MLDDRFPTREGGVKIVFDVPESHVGEATRFVAASGFEVRRYYEAGPEHGPGRAPAGWIRLGAERALHEFTEAEQSRIVMEFDAVRDAARTAGIACLQLGVDTWTAGGGGAGVRELRRPRPRASGAAAELEPAP